MKKLSAYWKVTKQAVLDFNNDNGFKLSASLSYSTIFAMAPLLIVMISLMGILFGEQAAAGNIYGQIRSLVGDNAAIQIQEIIKNIKQSQHTMTGAIIGGVILIIASTGVFTEIQGSINHMWSIQAKPKKEILKFLGNRLLSFSLIIGLGFISMVCLILNSLMDLLSNYLKNYFTNFSVRFFYFINLGLTLTVVILLFAIIFRILPDAIIRWRDAFIGATFTGILFMLGKFIIGVYVSHSNIGIVYGTATSIIVILTWVYYSSIILYLGAEFTKIYARDYGGGIRPTDTAVFVIRKEVERLDS